MQIGEKLKNKRNEAGLSQEVLAERIGVSRQTISNWENNRSYPDIGSVLRLSDLYGISLDELLKEDTNMRKHVEETAKLPVRLWRFLCGLTIALIPLNALLHYWGFTSAAMAMKILAIVFIPVLIFTRWKFTGGEKKELFILLGFYVLLTAGEIISLRDDFWRGSNLLMLIMAFVLIYGYGHYLGKGLIYWLLIFLYFGTPVYMAVDARLPEVKCLDGDWKETGGGYPIRWHSATDPLGEDDWKFPVIEPEDLFIYWGNETVTTLTVEEIIGDGEAVLRTLHRDENGNFPLGEIIPEPGVIHTYRIEYLGGAFVLQVRSLS